MDRSSILRQVFKMGQQGLTIKTVHLDSRWGVIISLKWTHAPYYAKSHEM